MKKAVILVIALTMTLTGCALFETPDINSLKKRVSALESRQDAIEGQTEGKSESVTYVSTAKIEETTIPEETTSISMTDKEVQRALKNAGYYYGDIDGKIGSKSKRAIREFQADNGLKVDGIAGPQTKKALLRYLDIK